VTGRSMAGTVAMSSPPEAAPTRAVSSEQSRHLQLAASERAVGFRFREPEGVRNCRLRTAKCDGVA
jgi:hypothetical protein